MLNVEQHNVAIPFNAQQILERHTMGGSFIEKSNQRINLFHQIAGIQKNRYPKAQIE